MAITNIQNQSSMYFANMQMYKKDTEHKGIGSVPTFNRSSVLTSSVGISGDAMRLYELSQKTTSGNPDLAPDKPINSPEMNLIDIEKQSNLLKSQENTDNLISAATFSDPKMRTQLQAYYESKVNELDQSINGQKAEPISFNKWCEFSAQSFSEINAGPTSIKAAQENLKNAEQNSPDSSSQVKMTFSNQGTLLAYIDSNGGLVTHRSGGLDSRELTQKADALGLSVEKRTSYLAREIQSTLANRYSDLKVTTYAEKNIPSRQEFSRMWYPDHDVDTEYKSAMNEAIDMLRKAQASHVQSESNIFEIQNFLIKQQQNSA